MPGRIRAVFTAFLSLSLTASLAIGSEEDVLTIETLKELVLAEMAEHEMVLLDQSTLSQSDAPDSKAPLRGRRAQLTLTWDREASPETNIASLGLDIKVREHIELMGGKIEMRGGSGDGFMLHYSHGNSLSILKLDFHRSESRIHALGFLITIDG